MPESTRRQIGKYQIQAELGRGGFGVVYSAYDPTVGRPVAVKVLTALGDSQLLTRFKNEAAAAGNLRHRNIVTIYDYGDDDGLPYIVMELLEGEDLNQIIAARKPMPLLQKVSIMVQVADGLRSAHRAGVVHRDVKPGNIRLLPDGTVKLMDFGIARLVAGSAGTRLTRQGHVIGTLYYMAPEQVLGEEVDALSDIFAYGSTYYELLTGKHPFQGHDPRSVFHKITAEDPEPIRNLVPDCPEALEKIVNRTLQKDRDLRYQSLRDVQVDTEPILIELRQERAESLVKDAKRLYETSDLENAQGVLGEVFDLDPANREARQLRETIQTQLLDRLLRPKVEALVKKADEALTARRFEDAIESFEAAFRLDRENRTVYDRLEDARRLLVLRREISGLIAEARRQFSKQNLEEALEILLGVMEKDPSDPEAQQWLDEVRTALTRREKERDYEEKLQRARELLAANSFEDSAKTLASLEPEFRQRSEVGTLDAQVRSARETFERKQLVNREIAAVREMLSGAQFEAAIKRVEILMNRFPEEVEPTKLFILAHKELAAYRKSQALTKLEKELDRLLASGHYERALSLVQQSLKTYPSEPRLLAAQRRIEEAWAHHKKEAAIRQLLDDGERLRTRNELENAVALLEGALLQYPDEARLTRPLSSARDALSAKRREEAVAALSAQAQAYLKQRRYQDALDALDRGLAENGADARLTGLRETVVAAQREWERAEAIRELVGKSQQLVTQSDFEAALGLLREGRERFGDEPKLIQALTVVQNAQAAWLREEAISRVCEQAQSQLNNREYQSAFESIDRGLAEYGADGRLSALREQVASAQAAWQRAEAIRQLVADSHQSLAERDFEGAIALLESGQQRYGAEPPLTEALSSARSGLAAKRRDEAIDASCSRAIALGEKHDFPNALQTIDRGLADYGSDARLTATREKVLGAKAAWERAEGIRQALENAHRQLDHKQPENALALLQSALGQFPDERGLLEARVAAEQALAVKRREQAIEALANEARAQARAGAYQDALELLDRGLQEYGGDDRLAALRTTVEGDKAASERAAAIAKCAGDGRRLIAQQDYEGAIALLTAGLNQFPAEPQLARALDSARAGLAARQHDEAIDAACRHAQAQLDQSDYRSALDAVDQALAHGFDRRLTALRDRVLSAKAASERSEAIRQVVADAHNSVARQDFNRAIAALESALKRYPGESLLAEALTSARTALEAKRRDDAIAALISQVQGLLDKRDFARALKTVDRGLVEQNGDVRLADAREKVLSTKAAWERAEAVRKALENANSLLAQNKPEAAAEFLEGALTRYPAEPQLTATLEAVRNRLASLRREKAIADLLRGGQRDLQAGKFDPAIEALDRGLQEYGVDRRLSDLRATVLAAKASWERAQALQHLLKDARAGIAGDEPESALTVLESGRAQFEGETQFEEMVAAAHRTIASKQRSQAIRALIENARQRIEEKNPEAALELVRGALSSYGDDPELRQALAAAEEAVLIAHKETAIAALSKETRIYIGTQDFPTALAMVEQGLKTYGPETRLADLRDSVLSAQAEWERLDALRKAVSEANHLVAQRSPEQASRLLETALTSFPGDSLLLDALASAREAVERKQREESLVKLCAEARSQLEHGKFDVALQQLERGLKDNPDDRRLLELRETVSAAKTEAQRLCDEIKSVVQSAQNLTEQGQREEAMALLERALAEHPANADLVAAIVGAIDDVGAAGTVAIDNICRNARQHMLTGNFDLAFHTLERALQLQNDEEQTSVQETGLKTRTQAAMAAGSGSALVRDSGSVASVKDETGELMLPGAPTEPTDEFAPPGTREDTSTGLFAPDILQGTGSAPPRVYTSAERPFRHRWLIAGVAAVLVLVSLTVLRLVRAPGLAVLQIRASPAGATLRVGDQTCSTPTCEFRLQPGQYRIQTSAPGYREVTTTATIRRGDAASQMVIALEPLSPAARITANFEDGEVTLDNRSAGRMQGGQFVVDHLTPGSHNLRVSGREGTASVSFDTAYAKLPAITRISRQNVDVIASTNFGNRAVVSCGDCTGGVSIDERSAGHLNNGAVSIDNVSDGTHRVKLGDERSLVFAATGAPGLDLAINSNRNFGALVVETGVDGVTVFVDDKKYPRPTSRGQLLIPAEAKSHTIRVAKDGYRAEPTELNVQLTRGDQFQARFKLSPEPAHLVVSRHLPGAAVWIDGSPAGAIGPDGSFAAQLPPGDHRVEFRKDGYVTAQLQRSFEPGRRVVVNPADAPLIAQVVNSPSVAVPPPAPKPDPKAVEQADWQRVAGTQNVAQLEDFLRSYPDGPHHEEAQARLKDMRQQRANAARETAWNAIDKNDKGSLTQFLSQYGDGAHAQDARALIATIDKQQRDDLAAAQRAKDRANLAAADSSTILNTLSQFEAAYNRKDLAALQSLWSGMPKNIVDSYRNQFRDAKSLDFRLTPDGQAEVNGDSATAVCSRTLRFIAKNGQRPPETNDRVRVALGRSGAQWVIRTITPF